MRMHVCYLDCHEAGVCCYLVITLKTYYVHYSWFTAIFDLFTDSPSCLLKLNDYIWGHLGQGPRPNGPADPCLFVMSNVRVMLMVLQYAQSCMRSHIITAARIRIALPTFLSAVQLLLCFLSFYSIYLALLSYRTCLIVSHV
jgi:hypothetical protein